MHNPVAAAVVACRVAIAALTHHVLTARKTVGLVCPDTCTTYAIVLGAKIVVIAVGGRDTAAAAFVRSPVAVVVHAVVTNFALGRVDV